MDFIAINSSKKSFLDPKGCSLPIGDVIYCLENMHPILGLDSSSIPSPHLSLSLVNIHYLQIFSNLL
jgi:hypothetical protein